MPKQLPREILLAKNPTARQLAEQRILKRISAAYFTKISDLSLEDLLLLEKLAELVWDDECLKW